MKLTLFILSILSFFFVAAQEGIPLSQDYLTSSWYLVHPSMAGAATTNQIRLTGKQQWFDVDDAPNLFTGSINGKVRPNIGVGAIVFKDTNGNFSQTGFYGTFAYHINLNYKAANLHQLSFGISGGILQRKLDERELLNPNFPDPAITGEVLNDTYANADFGMSYFKGDFFLLQSFKNILPINKDNFVIVPNSGEPDNDMRFITTLGYTFNVGQSKVDLEPSVLFQNTPESKESIIDANLKAYYPIQEYATIWGGVSYRTNFDSTEFTQDNVTIEKQRFKSFSPFVGIDYKEFIFAYTYTSQLDTIVISNSGTHQITLGYNFKGNKKYRTTRFNCNCPAVN